jgi:hypothetical protein
MDPENPSPSFEQKEAIATKEKYNLTTTVNTRGQTTRRYCGVRSLLKLPAGQRIAEKELRNAICSLCVLW